MILCALFTHFSTAKLIPRITDYYNCYYIYLTCRHYINYICRMFLFIIWKASSQNNVSLKKCWYFLTILDIWHWKLKKTFFKHPVKQHCLSQSYFISKECSKAFQWIVLSTTRYNNAPNMRRTQNHYKRTKLNARVIVIKKRNTFTVHYNSTAVKHYEKKHIEK